MDSGMDLFDFLNEAELQQYYDSFARDLKIRKTSQIKYATDEDLSSLGMSRPERRRLRKFYARHFPQSYFAKIKRLLGPAKRDDASVRADVEPEEKSGAAKATSSDSVGRVANKHIIPAENITVNKELGTGEFGVVQQGVWTDEGRSVQVAIKCLYREQMHTNAMEFLKEAAIMHDIDHGGVVRLYGVVLHPRSLMLVTELAPLRSLLECLKEVNLRACFPVTALCEFSVQICEGMAYLENKRLIHRDLAARNILVFTKNRVKISDFGLSRALGAGKDYYQTNFNVNLKLPIAWCAPECISYLRFTSASDVWAYAVTLWEMFSYGFQPWAAFSGHQILVAIDSPNFQRLEQPERCPREYYSLMLKCWNHEPVRRPKFCEILSSLPDCKPVQVQAVTSNNFYSNVKKTDHLSYRNEDVITVLDKSSPSRWKGALDDGATGFFNPLNTVSYLGSSLPGAGGRSRFRRPSAEFAGGGLRGALVRNDGDRSSVSRRRLRSDMISAPQGDVKHTGHVGLDGAYFGDISFLEYNNLPRQVVTPYKPSEDLEQIPLIDPNSPSHLTGDGSLLEPHALLLREPVAHGDESPNDETKDSPDSAGYASEDSPNALREYGNVLSPIRDPGGSNVGFNFDSVPVQKHSSKFKWPKNKSAKSFSSDTFMTELKNTASLSSDLCKPNGETDDDSVEAQTHDYQEISDDDDQKGSDFGQSILDEMELMFQSYGDTTKSTNSSNQDFICTNTHNELVEINSKLSNLNVTSKKRQTVKPISAHDQRTLDSAIALANKITVKSMTDLEQEETPGTPTSPAERSKFSFRFPLVGNGSGNCQSSVAASFGTVARGIEPPQGHRSERRNFSQEAQSVPDIQTSLTEESKLAYESLVEQPCRLETTLLKIKHKQVGPLQISSQPNMCKSQMNTINNPKISNDTPKSFSNLTTLKSTDLLKGKVNKNNLNNLDSSTESPRACDDLNSNKKKEANPACGNEEFTFSRNVDSADSTLDDDEIKQNCNPIPLPPKDPTKHQDIGKRHVRKHPLVIGKTNLQLNNYSIENNFGKLPQNFLHEQSSPTLIGKNMTDDVFLNGDFHDLIASSAQSHLPVVNSEYDQNIFPNQYLNINHNSSLNPFDTPSLNFEAEIENNLISNDCCDGAVQNFKLDVSNFKEQNLSICEISSNPSTSLFEPNSLLKNVNNKNLFNPGRDEEFMLSVDKDHSSLDLNFIDDSPDVPFCSFDVNAINNPSLRKDSDDQQKVSITSGPDIKTSASHRREVEELECNNLLKYSSDRVSVEDLLEFADQKPCGRQRGTDSDEVRIMSKVLNQQVTPEACLLALEFTSWNVHRAIKLAQLRFMGLDSPTLHECSAALDGCEWDVARAATMLADSVDIAQV